MDFFSGKSDTQLRGMMEAFEARKCGNCDHWLKSICPREATSQPTRGSSPCKEFKLDFANEHRIREIKLELVTRNI